MGREACHPSYIRPQPCEWTTYLCKIYKSPRPTPGQVDEVGGKGTVGLCPHDQSPESLRSQQMLGVGGTSGGRQAQCLGSRGGLGARKKGLTSHFTVLTIATYCHTEQR